MLFTIRRSSIIFDIVIVLLDIAIGIIGERWFGELLGGPVETNAGIFLSIFLLLTCATYFWALLKFRDHMRSNIFLKATNNDYAALMFNSVIAGAMMPMCFYAFWPTMPMGVFIALFFIIFTGWFVIHNNTFNLAAKPKVAEVADNKIRYKILFMMLPFSAAAMAPTNAIATMLKDANIENNNDPLTLIISIIVEAFLVTFLAWATAYIPRRITKAALEMPSSGKIFFWMLMLDYLFKVIPWNY
jgi:hypothetical protein